MSEYGLKILNIAAASIYENNLGVRENLDTKEAFLPTSLFLDFLLDNGLDVWKGESTRSIIGLTFDYGSRDYRQDRTHLERLLKQADTDERKQRIQNLIVAADNNKDKYVKKTKDELREIFYRDGIDVTYRTHDKSGNVIRSETRHYKMLYRTPGKAKKGECLFCDEKIYDKVHEFLYIGLRLPYDKAPIVEIGAYSSLITSSVVGRIKIDPSEILVMNDCDVGFITDVVSIEVNSARECIAVHRGNYEVTNTMWDGQALCDSSIFPSWADGYILLRHHMTKCAAFCTHIQKYFRDFCEESGVDYDTLTIEDCWGNRHLAKNIKLITTTNAMKWMKFGVTFEYWSEWVRKNGSLFGIVKTAHQSKLGEVQQMSYQMINTLGMDTMYSVMQPTVDYVQKLQTDDKVFMQYLKRNQNFSNDFEVLIALVNHNPDFILSEYFKERRQRIIRAYITNMKTGKLIQNADNLVIVGSPFAMLMQSVGLEPRGDPTFEHDNGVIQCYTERFENDEYLASFRSPHNSSNNIGYLHNHYHDYFKKYFTLGKQIIAVNMNGTDFQDRHNGSDQDSDSVYVTNHPEIVSHAGYCYRNYHTIVNNIPKESKTYKNTPEDFAAIDTRLAASQNDIGISSNLAAICLSYAYTTPKEKYNDYICILSVLAQAAIDSSKRAYSVDITSEIKRIKKDMDTKTNGYPRFWRCIHPEYQGYINNGLKCPMNEVAQFKPMRPHHNPNPIPNQNFFIKYELTESRRKCKRIESLIQKYSLELLDYNKSEEKEYEDYLLLRQDFDQLVLDIRQTYISNNYLGLMSWLIDRSLKISDKVLAASKQMKSNLDKNRSVLLKVLYTVSPNQFLQCFTQKCTAGKSSN